MYEQLNALDNAAVARTGRCINIFHDLMGKQPDYVSIIDSTDKGSNLQTYQSAKHIKIRFDPLCTVLLLVVVLF